MLFAPRHFASEHPTCKGKHDGNFPDKAMCMTSSGQGNTNKDSETELDQKKKKKTRIISIVTMTQS